MDINKITGQIVDAAMKVHTALGPGLLESAYEACLAHELRKQGFSIERQKRKCQSNTMEFRSMSAIG